MTASASSKSIIPGMLPFSLKRISYVGNVVVEISDIAVGSTFFLKPKRLNF